MPTFVMLIAAYGICFGFMNKLPFLYARRPFLDALLSCSFCMGFHSGVVVWLLAHLAGFIPWGGPFYFEIPLWGLASAAFCYAVDTLLRAVESHTHSEDHQEDHEKADPQWLPEGMEHLGADSSRFGEA
jgi:hypothetical protein